MESDTFDGRMSEMRDSPWLASEDLENPDGDGWIEAVVTIVAVMEIRNAQFKGGRTKKKGFALKFREYERMLFLNGVNRETLRELHGRKAADQIGKTIVLYVNPKVPLAGKMVPGIRIKHHEPQAGRQPAKQPALTPEEQEFVETAREEIKKAQSQEELNAYITILNSKSSAVKAALREDCAKRKEELSQ
jgi:hypothetical protein